LLHKSTSRRIHCQIKSKLLDSFCDLILP
jgi:hypothetical protein